MTTFDIDLALELKRRNAHPHQISAETGIPQHLLPFLALLTRGPLRFAMFHGKRDSSH